MTEGHIADRLCELLGHDRCLINHHHVVEPILQNSGCITLEDKLIDTLVSKVLKHEFHITDLIRKLVLLMMVFSELVSKSICRRMHVRVTVEFSLGASSVWTVEAVRDAIILSNVSWTVQAAESQNTWSE